MTGFGLRAGDIVIERTAGGGGYGDPLERDAQAVVRDLRFGYVSATAAEATYGVALRDGDDDAERTLALRARLRAAGGRAHDAGRRRGARGLPTDVAPCAVAAKRLGIGDGGALVEVARDHGPSLLGWVAHRRRRADDACALAVFVLLGSRSAMRCDACSTTTLLTIEGMSDSACKTPEIVAPLSNSQ